MRSLHLGFMISLFFFFFFVPGSDFDFIFLILFLFAARMRNLDSLTSSLAISGAFSFFNFIFFD